MIRSYINRNSFLFFLITAISIGGVIVYAMNNMQVNDEKPDNTLGNSTQATQNTNQADPQTIQNFDINNQTFQEPQQEAPAEPSAQPTTPQQNEVAKKDAQVTQVTELTINDITQGQGAEVKEGDRAEVNYLGTFLDGSKFDSSYDRGETFTFSVGAGEVIQGWDQGLIGMKKGGKRELLIPADLAYGERGVPGAIPPNTPLKFEIELININP